MRNFTLDEFRCKCCGEARMDEDFLYMLDKARDIAGVPFVINSGYRCLSHNRAVGSKDTSSHVLGLAADIKATTSRERWKIVEALIVVGISRIGISAREGFIHCDFDLDKPKELIWIY